MAERWYFYVNYTMDAAWMMEHFIMALSWVIVCHGLKWEKRKILRRISVSANEINLSQDTTPM